VIGGLAQASQEAASTLPKDETALSANSAGGAVLEEPVDIS
jgi:hypothetical protein